MRPRLQRTSALTCHSRISSAWSCTAPRHFSNAKHHQIRRIRFVTADVAIVDIDNEIRGVKTMPAGIAGPPDGVLKTQLMEVVVRRDNRWVIEAYHNVDTKPSN